MKKYKDVLIVIPARFKSTRFPGKPLKKILGKLMIERVWEKCVKAINKENVVVATDDYRIFSFCKLKKINVIITSSSCKTGTDRVFEVSRLKKYKYYVNVQGDEPLIKPQNIKKIIDFGLKNKSYVINGMCKINNKKDYYNLNVPKVVVNRFNELVYMSRAGIPSNKKGIFSKSYKQVCIYFFPSKILSTFGKFKKKMNLENYEDIEILRLVENNIKVKMLKFSETSISVDTLKDLKKVEKILK